MHSAASAAAASASISQAVANLTWYDPTTWPSGISGEVQQEATSVKDKLNKMSMLSVRYDPRTPCGGFYN